MANQREFGVFLRPPESVVDANAFGVSIEAAARNSFYCGDMLAPPRGKRGADTAALIKAALESHQVALRTMFVGVEGETYASLGDALRSNGIVNRDTREDRIREIFEVAELTLGVGGTRVGLHPGLIHFGNVHEMSEVIRNLVDDLRSMGVGFVIETGPVEAIVMQALLQMIDRPNDLFFNLDPGNIILYQLSDTPTRYLEGILGPLSPKQILLHAKDADGSNFDVSHPWFGGKDVPIGQGQVDFDELLELLDAEGNCCDIIIEREPSPEDKPRQMEDVCAGREQLQVYMS